MNNQGQRKAEYLLAKNFLWGVGGELHYEDVHVIEETKYLNFSYNLFF